MGCEGCRTCGGSEHFCSRVHVVECVIEGEVVTEGVVEEEVVGGGGRGRIGGESDSKGGGNCKFGGVC